MRLILQHIQTAHTPESLVAALRGEPGVVLLRSGAFDSPQARYSFVTARPFLTFRSFGSRCELDSPHHTRFGNPWQVLDTLMARYEMPDEIDLPFPLGGCFGFWGYDLKNFVEPKLPRTAINDLELPDCQTGFYDSLVAFDHRMDQVWIISTGLQADGARDPARARRQLGFWTDLMQTAPEAEKPASSPRPGLISVSCKNIGKAGFSFPRPAQAGRGKGRGESRKEPPLPGPLLHKCVEERETSAFHPGIQGENVVTGNHSRAEFIAKVERALEYIRAGDIYQANLSHRLTARVDLPGWDFFQRLCEVSPAPFAAWLDCGDFQLCSSSPELFLRMSGRDIQTRPIKGTRPRSSDAMRDAQLTYELQTSAKDMAELVMITDLLRNDLGKVCEYGSVETPELVRLERYAHVQHLVSTVTGRLRGDQTHLSAFASCFPGGSVTGAPKIRAMEIIDELESLSRGAYTGSIGYLGFNRESQLSIAIRTAVCRAGAIHFHVGAGIVADSVPGAEYDETLTKAGGFFAALRHFASRENPVQPRA
ncbi:MAG: aminodeoxychorismate synthase component I [Verrucomicrobiota bacterium]